MKLKDGGRNVGRSGGTPRVRREGRVKSTSAPKLPKKEAHLMGGERSVLGASILRRDAYVPLANSFTYRTKSSWGENIILLRFSWHPNDLFSQHKTRQHETRQDQDKDCPGIG